MFKLINGSCADQVVDVVVNAEILLSDDAIAIYDRIIELRELNNETSEWFLAENGDYISDNKMDKALRKLCNELGITERGCLNPVNSINNSPRCLILSQECCLI